MFLDLALMFCFPAAMCFAASMDFFTMTIPNRIVLFLVGAFALLVPFTGLSLYDIGMHILAGTSMLVVGILFFSRGWIGGGDAKIFAAASLWFGFDHLLQYIFLSSIFGGILTLAIIFARKAPLPEFLAGQGWALRLHDYQGGIPYGVALGTAALFIYPNTEWMKITLTNG